MAKRKSGRKEQRRKEAQQQKRRRYIMIGVAIGAVVLALAALVFIRSRGQDIEGVFSFGTQERGHDDSIIYEEANLPPVGGVHSPRWQTCGIYEQTIDTKNGVHSMEHGAVWITYNPDLPAADVQSLQDLVRGQSYLLLSPYPDLSSDIVILGAHGKGILAHTFLGSVPQKVLRRSRRPVLVVPIPKDATDIDL